MNRKKKDKLVTKKLPVKPTEFFIGRDEELKKIEDYLSNNDNNKLLLLNGLGGIGKTELCKKYLYKNYEKYEHIGWINYLTSLKESIVSQVNYPLDKDDDLETQYNQIIKHLKSLPANSLIVIDNVEKENDEKIEDFTSMTFSVLFSSRNKMDERKEIKKLEVNFLEKEKCFELFCKLFCENNELDPKTLKESVKETIYKIIEMAGYHTLTVELLAKVANSSNYSIEKFYTLLQEKGFNLSDKVNIQWHDTKDKDTLLNHLEKVFTISNLNDEEKNILLNLSIIPSVQLPIDFVKDILVLENNDSIDSLIEKGWIKKEKNENGEVFISVHNIIQELVKKQNTPSFEKCKNIVNSFARLLYYEENENPLDRKDFVSFAVSILENLKEKNKNIGTLNNNLSLIYKAKGEIDNALEYALKAKDIWEKVLAPNHPSLASSYNNLSLIYKDLGEIDNALEYALKAKEIWEKILPPHPNLAQSYNNLSLIYQAKGEIDNALEYALKAKEIREKVLPPNHSDLAQSYNNLSTIYKDKRDFDNALKYALKAIEIREKVLAPNHPDLATSYNNFSAIFFDKRDFDNALTYSIKATEIREKVLPDNHPSLATSYNNLSTIYFNKKEFDNALEYALKAKNIWENVLPANHPNLITVNENYLMICQAYFESKKESIIKKIFKPIKKLFSKIASGK